MILIIMHSLTLFITKIDANPDKDTTEKFQEINQAYEAVLKSSRGSGFRRPDGSYANDHATEEQQAPPPKYDPHAPFGSGMGYNDPNVKRRYEQYQRHSATTSDYLYNTDSHFGEEYVPPPDSTYSAQQQQRQHHDPIYGPSFGTNRVRPYGSESSSGASSSSRQGVRVRTLGVGARAASSYNNVASSSVPNYSTVGPSTTSSHAYTDTYNHAHGTPTDSETPSFFGGSVGFRDMNGERKVVVGDDVQSRLQVDFMTGIFGGTQMLEYNHLEPCYPCHGASCGFCQGRGATEKVTQIKVKVPAGAKDGTWLRFAGEGNAGPNKGPAGDLHVVLDVNAGNAVFSNVQRAISSFLVAWRTIRLRVKMPFMQLKRADQSISRYYTRAGQSISAVCGMIFQRSKGITTLFNRNQRRAPPPPSAPYHGSAGTSPMSNTGTFSFGKDYGPDPSAPFGSGHGYNDPDVRRRQEQQARHSAKNSDYLYKQSPFGDVL